MWIGSTWCVAAVALAVVTGSAFAQVPRSFEASPDIYKIVAQDDQYLTIEVMWKPGQRDQFHSHPKSLSYRVTDCNLRIVSIRRMAKVRTLS